MISAMDREEFDRAFQDFAPYLQHGVKSKGFAWLLEKLDVAQPASSPAGPQDGE